MNWYNHYLGDYIKDTSDLSVTEHGAYRLLLDHYYSTEQPLPLSTNKLNRICRAVNRTEKTAILHVIYKYFTKTEYGYYNKKCAEIIEKYQKRREINRKNASHSHSDSLSDSVRNPITTNQYPQENNKVREKKFSDADLGLAEKIFNLILILNPNHKKPNLEKWANTIRLMVERDNRTHDEILKLFSWANNHDFWQTNILSPDKLREQWDKLVIQKNQKPKTEKKQSGGTPSNREIEQMANRSGITAKPGEDYPSLYRRVLEANR